MLSFQALVAHRRPDPSTRFQGKLLSFDPGETTGWCVFDCTPERTHMIAHDHLICKPFEKGIDGVQDLIVSHKPDHVHYEDYRVYGYKTDQHAWAGLHTPQLIGAIRTSCRFLKINPSTKMAQEPKGFCTDEKLHDWGFYTTKKHARDAIRHALFYILFQHGQEAK